MLQPAPLITRENANKMREKAYESRIQKKNAEIAELREQLAAALAVAQDDEMQRKHVLRLQMAKCDEMMAKTRDPADFKRWAESKAKLWELLYPKPGSLRPSKSRDRAPAFTPIAPLPVEPVPALVAPGSQQDHKTKTAPAQVAV